MAQATAIEWTDLSWNPVHGCSKVSPGCAHCYAETLSLRYKQTKAPWTPANAADNVQLKPHKLREPLSRGEKWQGLGAAAAAAGKSDGKLVFVNSTSDLFHDLVPDEFIAQVFAVMQTAGGRHGHAFQVLTKRPERMRDLLRDRDFWSLVFREAVKLPGDHTHAAPVLYRDGMWILENVWLGVSIENRRFVDRADLLRETPAAVRFISAEPLLGSLCTFMYCSTCSIEGPDFQCDECEGVVCWPLQDGGLDLTDIDWLIVGGESGPKHRPMRAAWACELRDLADMYETAFLFKQWGGATSKRGGRELDGRTWDEFPNVGDWRS